MSYNFACTLATTLGDPEGALDLLAPVFALETRDAVNWAKTDPDLASLREHPRFIAMLAAAEERLGPPDDLTA
jgi:hypothetical protein